MELAHFYHRFTETADAAAYPSRLPREDKSRFKSRPVPDTKALSVGPRQDTTHRATATDGACSRPDYSVMARECPAAHPSSDGHETSQSEAGRREAPDRERQLTKPMSGQPGWAIPPGL